MQGGVNKNESIFLKSRKAEAMKGIFNFFQLNQERCSRRKYDWDYRYLPNEFDGARPLLQQKGVSGDL